MTEMLAIVTSALLFLAATVTPTLPQLPRPDADLHTLTLAHGAVGAVLDTVSNPRCYVILLFDGSISDTNFFEDMDQSPNLLGMSVFEVTADGLGANVSEAHFANVFGEAWRVSWCLTVVVVSDDPAFLATFAQSSLKAGHLVSSTKFLAVTRLPLSGLQDLQRIFSMTNSMFLIADATRGSQRCGIYIHLPYSPAGSQALRVASWTPHLGLTLTTHLPLFPDKFSRFLHRPSLVATAEEDSILIAFMVDDPKVPGGQRLVFKGAMASTLDYASKGMNFSYTYVRPPDGAWGVKRSDGSWSGMVGQVTRETVDIALGPFSPTTSRGEVAQFTWPVWLDEWKIVAGRGRPEVDPWSFLLPLAPLVWVAILTALLVVVATVFLLSSCFSLKASTQRMWSTDTFSFIRVLFQQDILIPVGWHWERVVLGVWMMMTLVLTRSYAGNLMSLLAVRHIPQPYQFLRDVLDDPSVTMIWMKNSVVFYYLQSVKSGIFREVGDLEKIDRLMYKDAKEFPSSADKLVRRGDYVLVILNIGAVILMAKDFSHKGRCDFYRSRDGYLSSPLTMIVKKYSPLAPALSKRFMTLMETGLTGYWLNSFLGNSTACRNSPKKITVTTQLSLKSLWGMFVALGVGHAVSLVVLFLETLSASYYTSTIQLLTHVIYKNLK